MVNNNSIYVFLFRSIRISEKRGITIEEFLNTFFTNCKQLLIQEISEIRPKIVISLGELAHQLIMEEFCWDTPTKMRDVFGNI